MTWGMSSFGRLSPDSYRASPMSAAEALGQEPTFLVGMEEHPRGPGNV
jgi:hypothetical protein